MTETVEAMKMFLSIKTITQNNLHYTVSILLPSLSNSRMWGKMCVTYLRRITKRLI